MVRVEKEKKQEKLDKEFPPWEYVEFEYQTVDFFASVRSLKRGQHNPKTPEVQNLITRDDVEEVFGPGGKMKTTNTYLDPKTLKALYNLFWRIWGRCEVKNNEFPAWLVYGYIAELMGVDIDWATAAASTAADRERKKGEREVGLGASVEASGIVSAAPGARSIGGEVTQVQLRVNREAPEYKSDVIQGASCPYEISSSVLERVEEVYFVLMDLLKRATRKVELMLEKKKEYEEQVIGMKFNIQDRKKLAMAAQEDFIAAEEDLNSLMNALPKLDEAVATKKLELEGCTSPEEKDNLEQTLQKCMKELQDAQMSVEKCKSDLLISRAKFEDKEKLVSLGDESFQEFEREKVMVDAHVFEVTEEVRHLEIEISSVYSQVQSMKARGGVSFWPKPILHPPGSEIELDNVLYVKPCGWCKRGYHCADFAITSCKHFFHPYRLAESLKETDECVVCGESLHPDWWFSWGLGLERPGMAERAKELELDQLQERFKQLLREDASDVSVSREMSWLHNTQGASSYDGGRSISRRFSVGASSYSPIGGRVCSNGVSNAAPPASPCALAQSEGESPLQKKSAHLDTSTFRDMQEPLTNDFPIVSTRQMQDIEQEPRAENHSEVQDKQEPRDVQLSIAATALVALTQGEDDEKSSSSTDIGGQDSPSSSTRSDETESVHDDGEGQHSTILDIKHGPLKNQGKVQRPKADNLYSFAGKRKANSSHDLPPRSKATKRSSTQHTPSNAGRRNKVPPATTTQTQNTRGSKVRMVDQIDDPKATKEVSEDGWAPAPKQPKQRWGVNERPEPIKTRLREKKDGK